ncbi:MAG TPA: ribonuclease P protein component [Thermopetrobacter sp.]|nr:ribonuclease P protein component [Thermopetrobacter sp.]
MKPRDRLPEPIRQRRDFIAARHAAHRAMPALIVQMRARGDDAPPRVGFTATKRIGNAVRRNRARRRLREAVRLLPQDALRDGHDYVFIARAMTPDVPFAQLRDQLARALRQLHADGPRHRRGRTAGSDP